MMKINIFRIKSQRIYASDLSLEEWYEEKDKLLSFDLNGFEWNESFGLFIGNGIQLKGINQKWIEKNAQKQIGQFILRYGKGYNNPDIEKRLALMSSIPNDESIDEKILLKYTIIAKMGSGAYGHVWKVIDKNNGQTYALKKVYSAFQNELDAERAYRQISILKKLQHPNVVKLQKVLRAKNNIDLYLVFKFIESDLFKAIKGNILGESHKKYIIYQIAKSLKYVHSAGEIHRDIRLSNILIDSECRIKLCDFGLSRTTFMYSLVEPVITEFIATRWYRAPEVMLGRKLYSYKSDVWSFACLIYEMYAYKALLPGKDNIDQIQKQLQFKGHPNDEEKKALKVNGIEKILGHFATEKKELSEQFGKIEDVKLNKLLSKMFEYDPCKRPSADEILQQSFLEELRNYDPELTAQEPIRLEQNENAKLTAAEYRQLIYELIAEKQVVESPKISASMNQNDSSVQKSNVSTVDRSLNKKSSQIIKHSSSSSVIQTSQRLPFHQNKPPPVEQKSTKTFLNLGNSPIIQSFTEPLQEDKINQKQHPFKKRKKRLIPIGPQSQHRHHHCPQSCGCQGS